MLSFSNHDIQFHGSTVYVCKCGIKKLVATATTRLPCHSDPIFWLIAIKIYLSVKCVAILCQVFYSLKPTLNPSKKI